MSKKIEYDKTLLPTYYIVGPRNDDIRTMFAFNGWLRVNEIEDAEAIVFQGGPDINPMLYGQRMHSSTRMSFNRDIEDIEALRKWKGPYEQYLIGICRGAQFLNVMVGGGSLWQHVNGHTDSHQILIKGKDPCVIQSSSTHHQMMRIGYGADILAVAKESTYKTDDKVEHRPDHNKPEEDIEAVYYPDRSTFCFQGHPEFNDSYNIAYQNFFMATIEDEILRGNKKEARIEAMKLRAADLRHKSAF